MKITFVSNYINHHQIPFCNTMREQLGDDFIFIQTEPMEEERIKLGWKQEENLPYVRYAYEEPEVCRELVMDSHMVIWGGAEDETMLKPRLATGKPVFRYSERLYKTGQWKAVSPRGLLKKFQDHTKYRKSKVYLLCAGAYVASDFQIIRAYPEKMLKWGYFPECMEYDLDELFSKKNHDKKELLWVGRFIDWKHPELVIELVQELAKKRIDFHVTMIGGGELSESVENLIIERNVEQFITLAGVKTPQEVRHAMEEANILLMTSDRQEGWGAVMNEAMNSGCTVIANRMEGATPYLICHGKNGFAYSEKEISEVVRILEELLNSKEYCERIGRNACRTIMEEWNAKVAAERLLQVCRNIVDGKELQYLWQSGPCSKAEVIKEKR